MTDKIVVVSTCGSLEEAETIARRLVDTRLAACVNIGNPVRSVYRWKGSVETGQEVPLLIKTRRDLFQALHVELAKLHSYQVPELIALPISEGADSYLKWMEQELAPSA